jgi:PPK2 family polyphosphate:nucleotide phosphotransferase
MQDERIARISGFVKPFMVKPGRPVILSQDFDPAYSSTTVQKEQSDDLLEEGIKLLCEYQARLAAQNTYGLLVIIQGLDAAGKDGTIKHVMSGVDPQGVHVVSFKAPSAEELDRDYLWRCAKSLPSRGDITIFNRSYYEEVLVVRVHPELLTAQRLPEKRGEIWKRRYREINNWERYLVDNGFRIVKLFLNVSKEEQRQRFLDRLEEPDKHWKFSAGDVAKRKHWAEYQNAYSEMLSNTSTSWAPWYVVPADKKWFARLVAAGAIIDALAKIDPQYPVVTGEALQALAEAKTALEAEAPKPKRTRTKAAAGQTDEPVAAESTVADAAEPATEQESAGPAPADAALPGPTRPGEIVLWGKRYRTDVVIEAGKVRKRNKKPSKAFKDDAGHTPLSPAEKIPWGAGGLIVGTGVAGGLPIMAEVFDEAAKRGVAVMPVPLDEALRTIGQMQREEVFAVLHITC